MSSSIPSWQILTAHAQSFRGARDLAFCLKVPLDSLLVWASSEGSGETARMRRLAWTFAARICYKYQIRLTRSIYATYKHSEPSLTSYLGWRKITTNCNMPHFIGSQTVFHVTKLSAWFYRDDKANAKANRDKHPIIQLAAIVYQNWAASWQNQQNECAPSEDSDQPGHPPSLMRVFAVRLMGS